MQCDMGCSNLRRAAGIGKKPAGGLPAIGEEMRDMIATEQYKKNRFAAQVSQVSGKLMEGGRKRVRHGRREKLKEAAYLWEIIGCILPHGELRASEEKD